MILYLAIALVGVLFLIVTAFLGEVFDFLHVDDGASPLSGKVIATALTAFGATGMLTRYAGWDDLIGAATSFVAALFIGASVWWATGALNRQAGSTETTMSSMRGRLAEVTIGIPAGSVGEVLLTASMSTRALIARSADGSAIAAGTTVRIIETVGNTVIVEPVSHQRDRAGSMAATTESGGSDG